MADDLPDLLGLLDLVTSLGLPPEPRGSSNAHAAANR